MTGKRKRASGPTDIKPETSRVVECEDNEADPEMKELEDVERASRTLFVGNLSANVNRKAVKRLFSRYGTIESVRLRGAIAENSRLSKRVAMISRRMAPGCDTILAFVVFQSGQDDLEGKMKRAQKELNMTMFKDKLLIVNPADFKRGGIKHSMFVGNMPFDVTVEEVVKVFRDATEDCGSNIVNVVLHRTDYREEHGNEGESPSGPGSVGSLKGSGYVVFDDVIGVNTALNLEGELQIRGRVLRMQPPSKSKRIKKKMKNEKIRLEKKAKRKERRRLEREASQREENFRKSYEGAGMKSSRERHKDRKKRGDLGITKKIRKTKAEKKLRKGIRAALKAEKERR